MRGQMVRYLRKLTRYWEYRDAWDDAAEYYEKAVMVDSTEEGFYRQLMICYQQLGHHNDALTTYERCRQAL